MHLSIQRNTEFWGCLANEALRRVRSLLSATHWRFVEPIAAGDEDNIFIVSQHYKDFAVA
ncbi:MAG TPA: hypothetical protein DCE56_02025 [Cyanobacteria bacterium UBA8553]|nr:hypothetical protein [Cyanobacteria bacterium UBA8553]HAJ60162.1 hypothetical protein [Cyanobacteria bacterium UBA8543]